MSETDSDYDIRSAPSNKHEKLPSSPSDVLKDNLKKTTTKMMIQDALIKLKNRKGVSLQAIKKHLKENFDVNTEKMNYIIKKSLKAGVEDGTFIQLKGVGASGSFKLAVSKEKNKKPKKKKEEPAPTKKRVEEKAEKTKKKVEEKEEKTKKKVAVVVEEKTKKSKVKTAKEQTPAKKRMIKLKRKSTGSVVKPPKMKPKLK